MANVNRIIEHDDPKFWDLIELLKYKKEFSAVQYDQHGYISYTQRLSDLGYSD